MTPAERERIWNNANEYVKLKDALKEAGWSEDDYNGKIIFNILECLKTKFS